MEVPYYTAQFDFRLRKALEPKRQAA